MNLLEVVKLKEDLLEVPYKDLRDKFIELGIGEIFKGGVKKEELIQLALQKLEEIKAFEGVGEVVIVDEIIVDNAEEISTVKSIEEVDAEIKEANKDIDQDFPQYPIKDEVDEQGFSWVEDAEVNLDEAIVRPVHSREVIQENLDNLQTVMYQATPHQRELILVKQSDLQAMLEAHDACDLLDLE